MVCVIRRLIFTLFSLLTLPGAYGSNCSPINLITEANSPFREMKVIDQRDLNICYAHAASQLAEYHLRQKGIQERVHPASFALLYAMAKNKVKLEIGHTNEVLELAHGQTLCKAQAVSALLQSQAQGEQSDIEILSLIEKRSTNSVHQLTELLSNCEKELKLELPRVKRLGYRDLPTHNDFEGKIISSLGSNTPLSISYCANIWTKAEFEGISFNEKGLRDRLQKDCHYHESLVVGRKLMGDSCHLLIRNTWGTNWRKSNKNWSCLCQDKATGEFRDDCRFENNKDLEVIACWLPAATVAKNTGVITFLERESSPPQNSVASHP